MMALDLVNPLSRLELNRLLGRKLMLDRGVGSSFGGPVGEAAPSSPGFDFNSLNPTDFMTGAPPGASMFGGNTNTNSYASVAPDHAPDPGGPGKSGLGMGPGGPSFGGYGQGVWDGSAFAPSAPD